MLKYIAKVVMMIAQKDFRDEELFDTRAVSEQNNIDVKIAAPLKQIAYGKLGGLVEPDYGFDEVEPARFEAIVFIGGPGAYDLIGQKNIQELIDKFKAADKIIAAICIAPAILAKAGVLTGKKATVHFSGVNYLQEAGAIYTEADVERDGNIITANGPAAASLFGQEVVKRIKAKVNRE